MDLDDLDIEQLRRRTGEKWRAFPDDVIPAWVADMDFPVAPPIRELLRRTAKEGDLGYPVNPGPEGLPAVFARRMKERFDLEVDPTLVDVITDVVQGIYIGIEVFSGPGDEVIVQSPIYPPFLRAVADTNRRLLDSPLVETEGGYRIDFEGLERAIGSRTRVLLLCNPHNPSGRVFTRDELGRLADLANSHDLVVLADEIHADLVFEPHRHIPFASLGPEAAARTLTLTSATKAFNIAGARCAVAVSGSAEIRERFNRIHRHVRGGIGSLGLAASEIAWTQCQPWLDEVLAYLRANRDFLAEYVQLHMPSVHHHPPEATYLAWLDFRELDLKPHPMRHFLERARVGLSKGHAFGPSSRTFVRINFATSRRILTQILERMKGSLDG